MTPRLKDKYKNEIVKNLMSKLNQKNIYSIPKIKKIVVNMGLGADGADANRETSQWGYQSLPTLTECRTNIQEYEQVSPASNSEEITSSVWRW